MGAPLCSPAIQAVPLSLLKGVCCSSGPPVKVPCRVPRIHSLLSWRLRPTLQLRGYHGPWCLRPRGSDTFHIRRPRRWHHRVCCRRSGYPASWASHGHSYRVFFSEEEIEAGSRATIVGPLTVPAPSFGPVGAALVPRAFLPGSLCTIPPVCSSAGLCNRTVGAIRCWHQAALRSCRSCHCSSLRPGYTLLRGGGPACRAHAQAPP